MGRFCVFYDRAGDSRYIGFLTGDYAVALEARTLTSTGEDTLFALYENETYSGGAAIAFLCSECHHEYDNGKVMTKQERREFGNKAVANTLIWMIESRVLKCS